MRRQQRIVYPRFVCGRLGAACRFTASSSPPAAGSSPVEEGEDIVTPWNVVSKGPKGIDYTRVMHTFKSQPVELPLLEKLASTAGLTGGVKDLHPLLKRGMAFSHRDLDEVIDEIAKGRKVYLYTGRGPSANSMHLGHCVPFVLSRYLQQLFDLPIVIQITDDEKFLFRDVPLKAKSGGSGDDLVTRNIKDILAFGFDPKRTFIFRNTEYIGKLYSTVVEVQRLMTLNAVKNTFDFKDTDSVGKAAFPAIQAAPCFASAFPEVLPVKGPNLRCLIPCAIDQDPFFILTRNIAPRIKRPKPALLHTRFLPALKGPTHKMSSSAEQNGVLSLGDTDGQIAKKLRSAFSGGRGTLEDLKLHGPDLDADVAYQMLRVFLQDDEQLAAVERQYSSGEMSTGDVKARATTVITDMLSDWRGKRSEVSAENLKLITSERNILFV